MSDILVILAGHASIDEIGADFPYISEEDVRAALAYAAAQTGHPVILAAA